MIYVLNFLTFVFALMVAFLPGVFGIMFTPSAHDNVWYNALNVSALTPNGWVFGVMWTILYTILGVALYLVMQSKNDSSKKMAYVLFLIHMIFNGMWSWLFFGVHFCVLALVVLFALFVFSVLMMLSFYKFSKLASYMIIPYLLWLGFAFYLNAFIVFMN